MKIRLNALSSIVCFLTFSGQAWGGQNIFEVSMPSRALYAF